MIHKRIFNIFHELENPYLGYSENTSRYSIAKEDGVYRLSVPVPGYQKNELAVSAKRNSIHVLAKTDRKVPAFVSKEFERTFEIEDIDVNSVSSKLEDGVLTIKFSSFIERGNRIVEIA